MDFIYGVVIALGVVAVIIQYVVIRNLKRINDLHLQHIDLLNLQVALLMHRPLTDYQQELLETLTDDLLS